MMALTELKPAALTAKSCQYGSQEAQEPSSFMKRMLHKTGLCEINQIRMLTSGDDDKDELLENYNMEKVTAIRENNLEKLRSILDGGGCFDACNRNGETLLHLACRRGSIEIVKFLVEEATVKIEVQDDLGRSALHDICWRPYPDFEMMELIMWKVSPAFLLAEDRRGHTCFDYCRERDWNKWTDFLQSHEGSIQRRATLYSKILNVTKD